MLLLSWRYITDKDNGIQSLWMWQCGVGGSKRGRANNYSHTPTQGWPWFLIDCYWSMSCFDFDPFSLCRLYHKVEFTLPGHQHDWIPTPICFQEDEDTNINGGLAIGSGMTLSTCKAFCAASNATVYYGFDWFPSTNSCWLTGNGPKRYGLSPGVQHYDIVRPDPRMCKQS